LRYAKSRLKSQSLNQDQIFRKMRKDIFWNYICLGSRDKLSLVKDLVKEERPQVLLLHETKMKHVDSLRVSVLAPGVVLRLLKEQAQYPSEYKLLKHVYT